jgi:RNA recognition motif-containing protein
MINIFIANLDWEISSEDLKATFSAFGAVTYAHVVFDKETKKSKGYGYVEMDSADEAIAAIQALKGLEVNGRALDVKIASPKENRQALKPTIPVKKPFSKDNRFQKPQPSASKRPRISPGAEKERFSNKPENKKED